MKSLENTRNIKHLRDLYKAFGVKQVISYCELARMSTLFAHITINQELNFVESEVYKLESKISIGICDSYISQQYSEAPQNVNI